MNYRQAYSSRSVTNTFVQHAWLPLVEGLVNLPSRIDLRLKHRRRYSGLVVSLRLRIVLTRPPEDNIYM